MTWDHIRNRFKPIDCTNEAMVGTVKVDITFEYVGDVKGAQIYD